MYVSDFYDKRTAHPDPDADWDRSNGRIYKIEAAGTKPPAKFDLAKLNVERTGRTPEAPERLVRRPGPRAARRERRDKRVVAGTARDWPGSRTTRGSRSAGCGRCTSRGGFDDDFAAEMLKHPAEYVRAWTVRLLGDAKSVSPAHREAVRGTGRDATPVPVVRAQLLCTAKRLPGEQALPIIERLVASRRGRRRSRHPVAAVVGDREPGDARIANA